MSALSNTIIDDDGIDVVPCEDETPAKHCTPVQGVQDKLDSVPAHDYEIPSRRLSIVVEGKDYLKYRDIFERLLFAEKMASTQKDAKILQAALTCLTERMEAITAEQDGDPFIAADHLFDSNGK